MTSDRSKNDVKTLFLISNSVVFAFGWSVFASGVGSIVIMGVSLANVVEAVIGIFIVLVAMGGYGGACGEHRKSLENYSGMMGALAVYGIVQLVRNKPAARAAEHYNDDLSDAEAGFIGLIFAVIMALVCAFVGCALSEFFPKEVKEANIPQKDEPTEV
ncbi:uncharacterized protein LOC133525508 [Cydia pomonella]|uniref:uncharacterized protein LOC133525508 n=1 Tax=Cydia pomonella TaxID=82600 RepID=UPI002ADD555C|nr:uncharacterized protein LOC133525508 [Cydia pomonella]